MKKYIWVILLTVFVSVILARSSYTGYTRKSNSNGCTCHGGSANASITVTITGASQIKAGATEMYQLTISGGNGTQVATDIAASSGSLSAYDTALKLSGSELITNGTKTYSNGSYTYSFKYTAPATLGTQTLYATGLASTGSGWNFAPDKTITVVSATNVESSSIPDKFSLEQNYPNPFNPSTIINYQISSARFVSLKIFDVVGKEVATLVNEIKQPGNYNSSFNTINYALPSGIYFYRLQAGNYTATKKMLLIK
jgi:hypothetical protein